MKPKISREGLLDEKKKIEDLLAQYRGRLDFGDDAEGGDSYEEETDEAEEYATYLGVRDVLQKRLKDIGDRISKMA